MENMEIQPGYIYDFISGVPVKATPEEIEAVQIFAHRLVEDYEFEKRQIQTRPQFRVRMRPSDEDRSYPVDIAVFKSEEKTENNLFLIVECKKKNRKDGLAQLKLYLGMSPAEIGVWFNGVDHAYLRKIVHLDGRITFDLLPNIPKANQRIEDIGLFKRKDLKRPSNLKAVFRDIRNHLAGNVTGITRDEALAQEIVSLLFCKIYDEVNTGKEEIVTFRSGQGEDPEKVRERIIDLFNNHVKDQYSDVFTDRDAITLDAESIVYVVGELQNYCITEAERDAVGDAFEVFIGPALRGSEGQFFTPRNVVQMVIDILDPEPGEMIIDPASGSGGFLIVALEHVWKKIEKQGEIKGWDSVQVERKKREVATRYFRGIDKDAFLAKVTKAYMAVIGDGRGGVFCENSLMPPSEWAYRTQDAIKLGSFDVIVTNPPFGAKIPIRGDALLSQYDFGHKWVKDKVSGELIRSNTLHTDQPPQILFLERCIQLLKPGGRLGIILPESILGNPSYTHVLKWLQKKVKINAVVTLPEALFKTSGKGGTHTKVCALFVERSSSPDEADYDIFMADAKWCGHDSRGNPTYRRDEKGVKVLLDDVPVIAQNYREFIKEKVRHIQDHLGFINKKSSIRNMVLVPKYYDPELSSQLEALSHTHDLIPISNLVKNKVLSISTGTEVGKMSYGTGPIPFIRTSDISNWELKIDPKQGVSEEVYELHKGKADVKAGDILMVRDGTYLIGTSVIVTESDTRILYQSHIYKIRVLKPKELSPWLLFACLNSPVVKKQIKSKQFTQDIIDTLGARIMELLIPIPKNKAKQEKIAIETREVVEARVALRNRARQVAIDVEGVRSLSEGDEELLENL